MKADETKRLRELERENARLKQTVAKRAVDIGILNKERHRSLVARMEALRKRRPRYGYRLIWALLRRKGWQVNRERVQRVWREHSFEVRRGEKGASGRERESMCAP